MKGKKKQLGLFERRELTPEAERLLGNFEAVAGAPGGVKRLRELLLELAATGKLVEYAAARRATSTTVGEFVSIQNGYAFKSEWFIGDGVRLARNVNIAHGSLRWDETVCISAELAREFGRFRLMAGDILISLDRPLIATGVKVAKVTSADLPCLLLQRVGRVQLKLENLLLPDFFFVWLQSLCFVRAIDPGRSKGVPHISSKNIEAIPFCPPSVEEQRATLTVLTQLLTLCDDLEARQAKQRETAARLNKAALDALASAEGPEELAESWRRVVDNYHTVLSAVEHVEALRSAVLGLAFRGRLVPQEPREGSGADLLKRIAVERGRGAGRVTEKEPKATTETPYPLPVGWVAARWAEVGRCQNGRAFPSAEYTDHGIRLLRPGNLHVSGTVRWTSENTRCMSEQYVVEYPGFIIGPGELVINLTAQSLKDAFLGRVCLTGPGERCLLNQRIARLTPILLDPRFLLWQFKAPLFRDYVAGLNKGTLIQHMFTSQVDDATILIPPLAEQKRIVAKVDHLMSLCDTLEAKLRRAEDGTRKLADALVAELLAS